MMVPPIAKLIQFCLEQRYEDPVKQWPAIDPTLAVDY
jgi:hypothetical protein